MKNRLMSRRWLMLIAVMIAAALVLAACGGDDDDDDGDDNDVLTAADLTVSDPWVRATVSMDTDTMGDDAMANEAADTDAPAAGDEDAADADDIAGMDDSGDMADMNMDGMLSVAFMVIRNDSDVDATLISASVDPAITETVELHETTLDDNDVMRMRPVEGGIVIPAGGSVELAPGGLHVMLLDVQQDLNPDDTVTLTLTFADGVTLDVDAPVRAMDAMPN